MGVADTHRQLDGETGEFIDLVHFDRAGEQQMAENIFAAIRLALERDLARRTD